MRRYSRSIPSVKPIYVRPSLMPQVRIRLKGQQLQHDRRRRAHTLGFQRVTVIDEDLDR